jgi:hypothetical protein
MAVDAEDIKISLCVADDRRKGRDVEKASAARHRGIAQRWQKRSRAAKLACTLTQARMR